MPRSCGSVQNYFRQVDFYPDLRRNQAVLKGMTVASARSGSGVRRSLPAEIPVVVHVLYRAEADDLSDEQIASQIDVLNEDYAAANGDLKNVPPVFTDRVGNPGLRFALATDTPYRRPDDRDHPPEDHGCGVRGRRPDEGRVDRRDRSVGHHALPQHLGLPAQRGRARLRAVPGRPAADRRRRDPHLGVRPRRRRGRPVRPRAHHDRRGGPLPQPLPHLGRSAGADVHAQVTVDDTPNQWGPNFGKPAFPSVLCENIPDGDLFMNYMDYVDDDTMVMFSDGQVARMHAALEFARPGLGRPADAPDSPDAPPAVAAPTVRRRKRAVS